MKYTTALFISAMILITSSPLTFAETSVINNVSVSASTGSNSANNGTVVEGKSTTRAFIETIVNGEVIEFIDEETTNAPGEDAVIEKSSSYESSDGKVKTNTNIFLQTGGSVEGEDKAAETLEKSVEQQEKQVIIENIKEEQAFLTIFFRKFKIYVLSIFK